MHLPDFRVPFFRPVIFLFVGCLRQGKSETWEHPKKGLNILSVEAIMDELTDGPIWYQNIIVKRVRFVRQCSFIVLGQFLL